MKRILLILLLSLSISIPASSDTIEELIPVNGYYISEREGQDCTVEGYPISCAYLLALYNKIKNEESTYALSKKRGQTI